MAEPTQPKPQPYQILLNGCATGCFVSVLAVLILFGALVLAITLAPKTTTPTTEQTNGK